MNNLKRIFAGLLSLVMLLGVVMIGPQTHVFAVNDDTTRSLDQREIEDYLKPDPSPMDAPATKVKLTEGGSKLGNHSTEISLNGKWEMAVGGNSASRIGASVTADIGDATKLFDGKWSADGDSWVAEGAGDHYVVLNMLSAIKADKFVVKHHGGDKATVDFRIEGSNDNAEWTTLHAVTGNRDEETVVLLGTPVSYQYYRLYVTKGASSGNTVRVRELQIIATASGDEVNLAKDCSVDTNSNSLASSGFDIGNLTNGRTDTQIGGAWVTDFAEKEGDTAWAIIDLGGAKNFSKVRVHHIGADGLAGSTADLNTKAFQILGSADGKEWDLLAEETNNDKAVNEYNVAGTGYRYVKLDVSAPHADGSSVGNNHIRIYEVEVLHTNSEETVLSEGLLAEADWSDAMPATIPGSVHTALLENGVIEDPYFGLNDAKAKEYSFKEYWLRTTFTLTADQLANVELAFDAVASFCTVYLNGVCLGYHNGAFGGPYVDATAAAVAGENELIVNVHGAPNRPRKSGEMPTFFGGGNPWLNLGWCDTVTFNCVYGWHYADIPSVGIYQDVYVDLIPEVEVQDPFIATVTTEGLMDFSVDLAGAAIAGKLVGEISPKNFSGKTYTFSYDVNATDKTNVRLQFTIPDPKLWWPNGHGEQNLYNLKVYFVDGDTVVDCATTSFGIRTLSVAPAGPEGTKENEDYYNWKFIINGEAIFLKGTGWCTLDALMRFSREDYDRYLYPAKLQNINFMRAWGSGMVETDTFYDLCDEYGIMILQEWPTAWDSYAVQPADVLMETVELNVVRLRNRPSLILWGGGNEGAAPLTGSGAYNPEVLNAMGKRTIELDGTRPWHRQDPYGGSWHDYSASWGGQNPTVNMTKEGIFIGEFGVDCFPNLESIIKYTPEDELQALADMEGSSFWAIDPSGVISHHTPMFNTSGDLARQIQHVTRYVAMDSLANAVLGSQIAQAIGVRYTVERARTRFPNATGATMYKLNDPYPAASWSTVDWYGAPKYGFYVIQDSFEPLTAIARLNDTAYYGKALDVPVYLVDDADELAGSSWSVNFRAYNSGATKIKDVFFTGKNSINDVLLAGTVSFTAEETKSAPLYIVVEVVKDGTLQGRNFYYINYETSQGCLFEMPKTSLSYTVKDNVFTVTNTGSVPAINVNFLCTEVSDTFRPEDNYFWLEPGETKTIKVNDATGVTGFTSWNLAVSDQTPPSVPGDLTAKVRNESTVALSWEASTDGESGIDRYEIYRNGVLIASISGKNTSYTDSALKENTTYTYQVKAVNNGLVASELSNTASAKTPADTVAPEVKRLSMDSRDKIVIELSEPVTAATAENVANYTISEGATITAAVLSADGKTVILSCGDLDPVKSYTVTVKGLQDRAGTPNTLADYTRSISYGLGGHWTFSEGSGDTTADSASGHGSATLDGVTWTTGMDGTDGAIQFTGDPNATLIVSESKLDPSNGLSFFARLKADSGTTEQNMHIIAAKNSKTTGHFELYINHSGELRFYAPELGDFGSGAIVEDNEWHTVGFTWDPGTGDLTFYLDGTAVSTVSAPGTISNVDAPFSIGRMVIEEGDVTFPFNGIIDEVWLFSRALGDSEAKGLYTGVSESGKSFVRFDIENVTVKLGTKPTIPASVDAIYDDGSRVSMAVTWSEIPADAFDKAGIVTLTGTVADMEEKVVYVITVEVAHEDDTADPGNTPDTGDGSDASANFLESPIFWIILGVALAVVIAVVVVLAVKKNKKQ